MTTTRRHQHDLDRIDTDDADACDFSFMLASFALDNALADRDAARHRLDAIERRQEEWDKRRSAAIRTARDVDAPASDVASALLFVAADASVRRALMADRRAASAAVVAAERALCDAREAFDDALAE